MAKLTVKVSNPMLKLVKEVCESLSCVEQVVLMKTTERVYRMQACPMAFWDTEEYEMDACSDGRFRYFQVVYTDECYAIPRNISTPYLLHEFKAKKVKDLDGLKAMLKEMIEI